ncbi:MAG TPA: ATP-binding protein [Candidatus Methylomirabilis sp.]|nr:ATP-binding protein [Candidatus Methylomirabilis sp.]
MSDRLLILVVDDEPGMRLGIERALRSFSVHLPDVDGEVSFTVEMADSGEAALTKIQTAPPDILLLDHKLPGMSGLDVLHELAETRPEILTIMITAYASLDMAIAATKRGAYDFLSKPFTPDELKAAVRKAAKHLILQRQARRLAAEKRQVRFQFISVLGHELKTPLAAVEGYLNILRDRTAGEDPAVYQQAVERSLVRLQGMRKLILDLLDLTRIESGNRERVLAELDVCEVATAAIETVMPDARAKQVSVDLRAAAPVRMLADRSELEIVLNNLLSNAVKYNRDGGQVTVRVALQGSQVSLAVSDTGIGMSPQETGRLFREFVRIKNPATRQILGSGLGLSIVKKVAALYGGDVTVQSQPGVGSTFCVLLDQVMPSGPAGSPA